MSKAFTFTHYSLTDSTKAPSSYIFTVSYICVYTHTHTHIYTHHVGSITPENSTNTVDDKGDSAGEDPGEENILSLSAPSGLCIDQT